MEILTQPWPWYVAGVLIGLTVPTLLIIGNKHFGISSSMRHICAACAPAGIKFFQYDWKKEAWNLFFVLGTFLGAVIATLFLADPNPVAVHPELAAYLAGGYRSQILRLSWKYWTRIKLVPDENVAMDEFRFISKDGQDDLTNKYFS